MDNLLKNYSYYRWWSYKLPLSSEQSFILAIHAQTDAIFYTLKDPHLMMIRLQWWHDAIIKNQKITGHPLLQYLPLNENNMIENLSQRIVIAINHAALLYEKPIWFDYHHALMNKDKIFWNNLIDEDTLYAMSHFLFIIHLPDFIRQHGTNMFSDNIVKNSHGNIHNPYHLEQWQEYIKNFVILPHKKLPKNPISYYIKLYQQHWQKLNYQIWDQSWQNLSSTALIKYNFLI